MDINKWAKDLSNQVYDEWKMSKNKYSFGENYGFAVFYSPVSENPNLMIIGYNPGGRENAFSKEREKATRIPEIHEYIQNKDKRKEYPIAGKMFNLFNDIGIIDWLEKSVKLNIIFFRSEKSKIWKSINRPSRREMEEFCFIKTKEIVDVLGPRYILTEGIATFRYLVSSVFKSGCEIPTFSPSPDQRKRCIYAKSKYESIPIIGIVHPTGAWPSNAEWSQIKGWLADDLR